MTKSERDRTTMTIKRLRAAVRIAIKWIDSPGLGAVTDARVSWLRNALRATDRSRRSKA